MPQDNKYSPYKLTIKKTDDTFHSYYLYLPAPDIDPSDTFKSYFLDMFVEDRFLPFRDIPVKEVSIVCDRFFPLFTNLQKGSKYRVAFYYGDQPTNTFNFTFFPSNFRVAVGDHNGGYHYTQLDDVRFFHYDTDNFNGFVATGVLDFDKLYKLGGDPNIGTFIFELPGKGNISIGRIQILLMPYSTTVVDALEDFHNTVQNGNATTSQLEQQSNSTSQELDAQLQQMEDFNNAFVEDFTNQNNVIKDELKKFDFSTNLRRCATWFNGQFSHFYRDMDDFRIIIIAPLLLGAVMLIIRGYTKYNRGG